MASYFRIMLGGKSSHAAECFEQGFIGADYDIRFDLSDKLGDDWRSFNKQMIPVFLEANPGKTRVSAGLGCGMLWTVAKGLAEGDVVLCPDGSNTYHVGVVSGPYYYAPGQVLPHRRPVQWQAVTIARSAMSEALRNSTGSIGTVCNVTKHAAEIEQLLSGQPTLTAEAAAEVAEELARFELEKHLEDFLVKNWQQTELGKTYDIFVEDGQLVGQQYSTDTGPIDILAVSKDGRELLVVELKRGRASDVVVGQLLRYMGYVQDDLATAGQRVRGVIIAQDDDNRIRRALTMVPSIEFFRYEVSFKLVRG